MASTLKFFSAEAAFFVIKKNAMHESISLETQQINTRFHLPRGGEMGGTHSARAPPVQLQNAAVGKVG